MLSGPKGTEEELMSQCSICGRTEPLFDLPGSTEKFCRVLEPLCGVPVPKNRFQESRLQNLDEERCGVVQAVFQRFS
jgi:hypothetical protein